METSFTPPSTSSTVTAPLPILDCKSCSCTSWIFLCSINDIVTTNAFLQQVGNALQTSNHIIHLPVSFPSSLLSTSIRSAWRSVDLCQQSRCKNTTIPHHCEPWCPHSGVQMA